MTCTRCHQFIIISLLNFISAFSAWAEPAQIIARSLEPAIEGSILTRYVNFSGAPNTDGYPAPSINERGDLLYFAYLGGSQFNGSSIAKVRSVEGEHRTAWLRSQRVPGESSYVGFGSLNLAQYNSWFILNNLGDLIFKSRLSGQDVTPADDEAIFLSRATGSFSQIVRKGDAAPGTSPVGYYQALFDPIASSTPYSESVLAFADLGSAVDAYDRGVWAPENLQHPLRIALEYPAPETSGAIVTGLSVIPVVDGPTLYIASLIGGDVQTIAIGTTSVMTDKGLWVESEPSSLPRLVARKGQIISISGQSFVISDLHDAVPPFSRKPTSTNAGQVYFSANLISFPNGASAGEAVLKWSQGILTKALKTGDSFNNDANLTFSSVSGNEDVPSLIVCGENLIVRGQVAGPGITYLNSPSLIEVTPSGPSVVIRARTQAPGAEVGAVFATSVSRTPIECNSHGAWTFKGQLQGTGVTSLNNIGVWFVNNGSPNLLIRKGATQIGGYRVTDTTESQFLGLKIDDEGSIVLRAQLTDISAPAFPSLSLITASMCSPPSVVVSTAPSHTLELVDGSNVQVTHLDINPAKYLNRSGELTLRAVIPSGVPGDPSEAILLTRLPSCESSCRADFDQSGSVDVQDLFSFLSAWFAQSMSADFDGSGDIAVPDIFAFLNVWFEGC